MENLSEALEKVAQRPSTTKLTQKQEQSQNDKSNSEIRIANSNYTNQEFKDVLLRASGIKDTQRKTFKDFNPNWNKGCEYALHLCLGWGQGEGNTFLTLYGKTGVGKTHLATACGLALIERMCATIFYQSSDLVRELQNSINNNDKNNRLDTLIGNVKKIDHLIIDDLGREYTTEWTASIYHEIIDYRYRNNLRTLITTNHSLEELKSIVGVPVVSRLTDSEIGTLVVMDGKDIRPTLSELIKNNDTK